MLETGESRAEELELQGEWNWSYPWKNAKGSGQQGSSLSLRFWT